MLSKESGNKQFTLLFVLSDIYRCFCALNVSSMLYIFFVSVVPTDLHFCEFVAFVITGNFILFVKIIHYQLATQS